jgi:hypothetical protein
VETGLTLRGKRSRRPDRGGSLQEKQNGIEQPDSGCDMGSVEISPCVFNDIVGSFFHFLKYVITIDIISVIEQYGK